jgi:amidase
MSSAPEALADLTATEAVRLLAAGELGSEELFDAHLAAVERWNDELNLVVAIDEQARARCRRADRLRVRGEATGVLHGLPMTVKDSFETEGLVTTSGSPALARYVPNRDAVAVGRLRAAGAIIYGKTNLPELGGDFQTCNDVYGLSRNPWDPARTVGGSSGGAAAAVATGMTLLELGSDIGGSIRAPAHYNGVAGHKPSWPAISERGHIPGPPGSFAPIDLGVVGPLGRTTADLALAMEVLVGSNLGGVPGGTLPKASIAEGRLDGLRVGLWIDDPAAPTSVEITTAVRAVAEELADRGAFVDESARPGPTLEEMTLVYMQLMMAVMGAGFDTERVERLDAEAGAPRGSTSDLSTAYARGVVQRHRDWLAVDEQRHRIAHAWQCLFERVDVVIAPCAPTTAFPHDVATPMASRTLAVDERHVEYLRHVVWSVPASLALLPATVVPIGASRTRLPIGVQIIGPRWADRTTLEVGRLIESVVGGFVPPPDPAGLTAHSPDR